MGLSMSHVRYRLDDHTHLFSALKQASCPGDSRLRKTETISTLPVFQPLEASMLSRTEAMPP